MYNVHAADLPVMMMMIIIIMGMMLMMGMMMMMVALVKCSGEGVPSCSHIVTPGRFLRTTRYLSQQQAKPEQCHVF